MKINNITHVKKIVVLTIMSALPVLACDTGGEDDINTKEKAEQDTSPETASDSAATGDDAAQDAGAPDSTNPNPETFTTALVVASDYQTGSYATIDLGDHTVTKDIDFIHSDSACHFDTLTNTPFLIRRLGSDAIDVLDRNSFEIATEYSVEPSSNPQGIAVVAGDRAYVPRFGSSEMLVIQPMTGEETGRVDLSQYADNDGNPEISGIATINGKVYALAQRLDRDNSWTPVGESYLVIVDAASGLLEGDLKLTGTNPDGALVYATALRKFIISEPGDRSTLDDGGIELFDPSTKSLSGFIVTETTLGGTVNKAVIVSETKGYVIIGVAGDNGNNTHVVSFNPQTGEKTGTLLQTEGWTYGNMALTPDLTELWIADRTAEKSGVRIFDTATDTEETTEPLNVGLPPSDICFTR